MNMILRCLTGLVAAIAVTGSLCAQTTSTATTPNSLSQERYKIGVCDWMILKRQKLGAFQLATAIGTDGVEVDMGSLGQRETFANSLTNDANCRVFLDKAGELNLEICSMAMSGFYAQSFAERATVLRMVQDCIDTMKAMNVTIAFLPLGVTSDLLAHPALRPVVVERLRAAGKLAEQAGVIIGVETQLDANGQIELLEEVGSPAIRIYYNLAHAIKHQRDYVAELKKLGRDRICQIHFSNTDGYWLQDDPQIRAPEIKAALDEMDWRGWLVIERSRNTNDVHNRLLNYGTNAAYLKSVFQKP